MTMDDNSWTIKNVFILKLCDLCKEANQNDVLSLNREPDAEILKRNLVNLVLCIIWRKQKFIQQRNWPIEIYE